jgi:hypothetical protein
MAWYDNNNLENDTPVTESLPKEEVMEAVTLSSQQIQNLSNQFGFEVSKDKDGTYMVIPNGSFDSPGKDNTKSFIDYWVGNSSPEKQTVEQKRKVKNSSYALMDEIFGIASLTLNAYADEALGIGFIEQPVDIEISDKTIEKQVKELLNKNNLIKRARSHIRNLCKWGDIGAQLLLPKDSSDPMDIKIKMITPDKWEAFFIEQGPIPFGYYINPQYGQVQKIKKEDILQPWEFVHFTVPDEENAPYGRSLLESMRTAFDQLATIEALLALSRVSRVERLIVKVPVNSTNPTAAMQKLNQIQSAWKNIMFSSKNSNTKSHAKTPALQEVMFFPSDEEYSIDRLQAGSGVEISATDDVEFFRDNVLMMTGLPKGYLLADETTDRYHALTAQDLKFARQLIPYQDAYAAGMTKLCMVLAGYLGADLEKLKVTVKIKRPIQMSDQLLQNNEAISRAAGEMIDNFKRANITMDEEGNEVSPDLPEDTYAKLLAELGMSDGIIKIFTSSSSDDKKLPSNSPDQDGISTSTSKGVLYDILENRSIAVSCNSQEVYLAEKGLFDFFNSGSRIGSSVLLEALDGDSKKVLTEDKKWKN